MPMLRPTDFRRDPSTTESVLTARLFLTLAVAFLGIAVAACGADGTTDQSGDFDVNQEENQEDEEVHYPAPPVITSIDTVVAPTITAGQTLHVNCVYLDPDGEPLELEGEEIPSERILLFPDDAFEKDGDNIIAVRAGQAEVACQAPQLGLTDEDPAQILIEPGPVHTTTASLDDHQIRAGESVAASCEAYDAYGNLIEDASFDLVADTSAPGIVVDSDELTASITTAGLFTFDCHVDGANRRFGDSVEVLPDLPAELFAELIPPQQIYSIGQVITIGTLVQDRFGNAITDALIEFEAQPAGESFGTGRFRFHEEGVYTVSAEVAEETRDDELLRRELEVVVNDTGPSINCADPFDGAMVDHDPGTALTFSGTVADTHGVDQVFVEGQEVTVNSQGEFSTSVNTRYGINFIDIVATDAHGEENVRTCAFLVSKRWAPESGYIDDAVSLALFQEAIDDKDFQGPSNIRSLNDLIMTVINSEGLRQELEDQIRAGNPYKVDTCNFDVYVNAVYYGGTQHVTALDLISGGLSLFARLNDIYIDLTLRDGSWYCFGPYNPTIVLEYIEMLATTELLMENNAPMLRLDEVIYVESGEVDAQGGNWFSDWVYSAVTDLFQGSFRDMVEDTFEDAITDNFDDLFGGLMDSLDTDTLAGQFGVSRLDGTGELSLDFGFGFSHAGATSARALFGLAPRITPTDGAGQGISSLGIAYPEGDKLMDTSSNSAAVAVHVSLVNQALHALWRGGLFHADVGGALGDDLPDGGAVELETRLPPVLVLQGDGSAELMLGPVRLSLIYPGIFDEPVILNLGLVGSTQINVQQEEVHFSAIQLQEFYLSAMDISLNEGTRDVLEDLLMGLFQDIIDQSLNEALPALPIPSFEIPASMGNYDLPAGQHLGIFNTYMNQTPRHLELHGEFGIE